MYMLVWCGMHSAQHILTKWLAFHNDTYSVPRCLCSEFVLYASYDVHFLSLCFNCRRFAGHWAAGMATIMDIWAYYSHLMEYRQCRCAVWLCMFAGIGAGVTCMSLLFHIFPGLLVWNTSCPMDTSCYRVLVVVRWYQDLDVCSVQYHVKSAGWSVNGYSAYWEITGTMHGWLPWCLWTCSSAMISDLCAAPVCALVYGVLRICCVLSQRSLGKCAGKALITVFSKYCMHSWWTDVCPCMLFPCQSVVIFFAVHFCI